ncbi:MAG: bacillithiol system redox-active protein YtxJ [Bacteroidota bacterium]
MGFLDRFRSDKESDIRREWKVLDSMDQLQQIIEGSHQRPAVIFKHSVTCGISAMSKFQLEREWDFQEEELDFYYLDLLNHRDISNKVADLTGVIHQSPQVILLKGGKAVYNTSHHNISIGALKQAIA